jgi:hypothetical protein
MLLIYCVKHWNHVLPANAKDIEALFASIIPMPFCAEHWKETEALLSSNILMPFCAKHWNHNDLTNDLNMMISC